MIPLDRIRACGNRDCRAVLPADPDDEPNAGFWVAKRESGPGSRVVRWQWLCRECQKQRQRVRSGIRRRGRPYEPRRPKISIEEERRRHREAYHRKVSKERARAKVRARQREVLRRARRRAGILPRFPDRPEERLNATPLRTLIRQAVERLGGGERGYETLAEAVGGVSGDRLRIVARGWYWKKLPTSGELRRYEVKHVSFDLAYRIVFALDLSLSDVWPEIFG